MLGHSSLDLNRVVSFAEHRGGAGKGTVSRADSRGLARRLCSIRGMWWWWLAWISVLWDWREDEELVLCGLSLRLHEPFRGNAHLRVLGAFVRHVCVFHNVCLSLKTLWDWRAESLCLMSVMASVKKKILIVPLSRLSWKSYQSSWSLLLCL